MKTDKFRDCTQCGGRGFIESTLLEKVQCQLCNGSGQVKVKDERQSILVSPNTKRILGNLAHDMKMNMREFTDEIADKITVEDGKLKVIG